MVAAIGSSPSVVANTGTSAFGLEAQVAQYKKQLADCVNCTATANSQAGKTLIQTLTNKISSAQARIEALTSSNSTHQTVAATNAIDTTSSTTPGQSKGSIDVLA
ncbi:MAG TPA: hypothetical protein VFW00_05685 [Rhodocyclaceae bacterium]|nr:hypothetical protein [Rhodocyclaceae bacterium]